MSEKYIKIWRFENAPKEYQELSDNGGDEDYIAFIPHDLNMDYFPFLECDHYGCCSINQYEVDGGKILIGCHA